MCDCEKHCLDGSDEKSCRLCYEGKDVYYPSAQNDMYDSSDGSQAVFVCGDGSKVPLDWFGDLVKDCLGTADDEIEYELFLSTKRTNFTGCLHEEETTCVDGFDKCFPIEATCVFEPLISGKAKFCANGAHLLLCDKADCQARYKCSHSYCIAIHRVCDGKWDCPNGEDEARFCEEKKCPGMLKCSESFVCVHPRYIRDGTPQCVVSNDDEKVFDNSCESWCNCHRMVKDCSSSEPKGIHIITSSSEYWTVLILQNNSFDSFHVGYLPHRLLRLVSLFQQYISNPSRSV